MGIYKDFLPEGTNLVSVFVQSIPYNLYTIAVVLMVPIIAITGWDFGPMRKAEERAFKNGKVFAHVSTCDSYVPKEGSKPTPWGLIIPIVVLITVLFATMYYTGPKEDGFWNAIFNCDTMGSLTVAFFVAAVVGVLVAMKSKVLTFKEAYQVFVDGFARMIEAIMILIFAWCIGGVTSDVGAADYIVSATQGFMTPGIMFISLFVVAAFTSFATGTSWGTFAIFLPIAVPLALANDVAVYPAIGAALAGGLFGDHCSPISDTTIMASLGSGSDHLDFVRAQLPYALLMAASSIVGYIVAAITMNGIISLIATIVCMICALYVIHLFEKKRATA